MAGVTPRQVYQALLAAGASTTQAIGIMANALAESGLNPEKINRADPNGGSYGIVQQNGAGYAGLVTGNPATDLKAQITILAQNGGFRAAAGSTPAQAAGNFAANYERCAGCQSGGPQNNARVANAATVAGWVASGKWPTSAGSASTAAAGTGGSSAASNSNSACLVGISGVSVPVVGSVGKVCFLSKSQARALIGGGLLLGSAFAGLVGLLILAAAGFKASGAGRAAGGALEATGAALAFVPGAEPAGLAVGAAGSTARRAAQPGAGGRSLDRRRKARAQKASAAAADQRRKEPRAGQGRRSNQPAAATPKAAPKAEPSQDEVRAQLRARGNQLAPRVNPRTA